MEPQSTFLSQSKLEKEEAEDDYVDAKATKSDNAKVPEHLWNYRITEKLMLTWKRTRRKELGGVRKHSRNTTRPFKPPLNFKKACDRLRFRWALKRIRKACLNYWKSKVRLDFKIWFSAEGCKHKDADQVLVDGEAAVDRAQGATWWGWDKGSSIFFWRWLPDYQESARVGIASMFVGDPLLKWSIV